MLIREVGRPGGTDPAYRIATRAWFNAVSMASGGMNARELEGMFARSGKSGSCSGIWGKYRDGKVCPKILPDFKGNPSIVERVERRFPGTKKWIAMPLWRVLGYSPMDMDQLRDLFWSFPGNIRKLLISERSPYKRIFWRRPMELRQLFGHLVNMGTLDAITAILGVIKEFETTQNQIMHQEALDWWQFCTPVLRKEPILMPLVVDINGIIEDRYCGTSYTTGLDGYFNFSKRDVRSALYWRGG